MQHNRNLDGVEHEELRKYQGLDIWFGEQIHDTLEDAYYLHWKKGESCPWFLWDVQANAAQSKALFDKLHGAIWNLYEVLKWRLNKELEVPFVEPENVVIDAKALLAAANVNVSGILLRIQEKFGISLQVAS